MKHECLHCGLPIEWYADFSEHIHSGTGDPQCTNLFTGELLSQWAEPKE